MGRFGAGVDITFDPRTIGMQIDDTIMQKNLTARLALTEKKYLIYISTKVLDGNIFLTGKVSEPEEKLKIIKLAWETKGVRSVKTAITIKGETNFKNSAKDAFTALSLIFKLIFFKVKSFDLKYGVEKTSSYAPSRLKSPRTNVFSSIAATQETLFTCPTNNSFSYCDFTSHFRISSSPEINVFSSIIILLLKTLAIFGFKFKLKLRSVKKSLSLGLKLLYLSKK